MTIFNHWTQNLAIIVTWHHIIIEPQGLVARDMRIPNDIALHVNAANLLFACR